MTKEEFFDTIIDIDLQIQKLKNQKAITVRNFEKQLKKEWKHLRACTNINDMSHWWYEIVEDEKKKKSDF